LTLGSPIRYDRRIGPTLGDHGVQAAISSGQLWKVRLAAVGAQTSLAFTIER
jgi:hypothetical protein